MGEVRELVDRYFEDLNNGCNNLISCEDLYKSIGRGDDLYILDIRKEEDFEKEHIDGGENVFWPYVGDFLNHLPKDKKIIVVCYSGQSAGQVVSLLRILGYDACSLKGGMNNGWKKGDLPLSSGCG